MIVVNYSDDYKEQLTSVMYDYFTEVEDDVIGDIATAIDVMISYGRHIYLLLAEGKVIGFTVMYINDQYGLLSPVAVNEYMYIVPNKRSGRAIKELVSMVAHYCNELQLPCIAVTYNNSSSTKVALTTGAKEIGVVVRTDVTTLVNYNKRLRKKNDTG